MVAGSAVTTPLAKLLDGLVPVPSGRDVLVSGLAMDSRSVCPGDLFLACAGSHSHGLMHLAEARAAGSRAVLWEPPAPPEVNTRAEDLLIAPGLGGLVGVIASRFHGNPSRELRIVGITGTDGKTSCAHYLAQCLTTADHPCGVLGTVGHGLYGALEDSTHTTPDPVTLQRLLVRMRHQGALDVVMEVSSHALDQGRIAGTRIRFALLTNLSRDHLDYHPTATHYAAAKSRLFHHSGLEAAILNNDDRLGRELLATLPGGAVVAYGFTPNVLPSEVKRYVLGSELQLSPGGLSLRVHSSWGDFAIATRLLGRFNASNVLATLATLLVMGESPEGSVRCLHQLRPVPGRMERHGGDGQPLVVVDYAHTPNSLDHALAALKEHARARLLCVFGCGGDRDPGKRPEMARVAERWADQIVVTDDNPRTEDPDQIISAIVDGFSHPRRVAVERNRRRAIGLAIAEAGPRDTVLIAGKGHERYQLVGHASHHFSDREVVLDILGLAA